MPEAKSTNRLTEVKELSAFDDLLNRDYEFGEADLETPKAKRVREAVSTLAEWALADQNIITESALDSINGLVAAIDKKIAEQVNAVLHHPKFQALESSWRGLHFLINNTESDVMLKIRVMNVSKKELHSELKKFKGTAWDQSSLFKKIYGAEYDTPGGSPYGCLVGDYTFDHSAPDVEMLAGLAKIAGAAHAPFITSPSPSLYNMKSWTDLNEPRDLKKIFEGDDYAAWRSLRKSDDSKYIGMAMPRVLGRLPYGEKTNPVEGFAFEEDVDGSNHDAYLWTNAAYAMAVNINRAFKHFGMCTAIRGHESGGMVEGLPVHTFPTADGKSEMKCPTEVSIGDRREKELSDLGMLPLQHWKGEDYAVFVGGQSLQAPERYMDDVDSANAELAARLPYLFAVSRFAHYLKVIAREKVGSFMSRDNMQTFLQNWIAQYVTTDDDASQETKSRYPLRSAEVVVEEVPGNPGYYTSRFALLPHYQLEGLTANLGLVSQLPSVRKGGG